MSHARSKPKYSHAQKTEAVEHYVSHDRCIAATIRALGYARVPLSTSKPNRLASSNTAFYATSSKHCRSAGTTLFALFKHRTADHSPNKISDIFERIATFLTKPGCNPIERPEADQTQQLQIHILPNHSLFSQ